jgi:hypothetical protein
VENRKELKVRTQKVGYYEIYFEGGGELPSFLQGIWNRRRAAQDAIEHYLYLQKLEDNRVAEKAAKEAEKAADNRASIKAKAEEKKAKAKAKKGDKVDGEGSVRV